MTGVLTAPTFARLIAEKDRVNYRDVRLNVTWLYRQTTTARIFRRGSAFQAWHGAERGKQQILILPPA